MAKYCKHCGNELLEEAVICPKCGCSAQEANVIQPDYRVLLNKTTLFVTIGSILLALGLFAWIGTSWLDLLYVVIGEQVQSLILGRRLPSMYTTCTTLATYSSIVFFLAAEIILLIPRGKFNAAFKKANFSLLMQNKTEYNQAAKKKNQELNNEIAGYRLSWILAIIACVLFVISVFIPSLGF